MSCQHFLIPLLAYYAFVTSASALEPIPVPPNSNQTGGFETKQSILNQTTTHVALDDDATMLFDDHAVLRCNKTAAFSVDMRSGDTARPFRLTEGAFSIHVANHPVSFLIRGTMITASNVDITVTKHLDNWLLGFTRYTQDGTLAMRPVDAPGKATRTRFVAPLNPGGPRYTAGLNPLAVPLVAGISHRITEDGLQATSGNEHAVLEEISAGFHPAPPPPALMPADIENAADFEAPRTKRTDETTDIEVEAIELDLEPGCIEVCRD